MALLFAEGFDAYSTTIGAVPTYRKWYPTNNPSNTIVAGRFAAYASNCRQFLNTKLYTPTATLICGFAIKRSQYITGQTSSIILTFNQGVTGTHCFLSVNKDDYLEFYRNGVGAAEVLLGTGTTKVRSGLWYYIEAKTTINTTTGAVTIRVNGLNDIVLTNVNTHGDESVTASDTTDSVCLYTDLSQGGSVTRSGTTISCSVTNNGPVYDDFYLCDTTGSVNNDFLGEVYVNTLFANGAGNYTNWTPNTGSNYTAVNEVAVNDDTTYVSTNTATTNDSYAFSNLTITHIVGGLNTNLIARMDDAGPHTVATLVRISSTDYVGTAISTTSTYTNLPQIYETSPNSGSAWTVSEVNAAEFGIQLVS